MRPDPRSARPGDARTNDTADEDRTDRLLSALADGDCRAILLATADEPRSAKELADRCDVPLSTTYRKLDRLADAGLLEERLRIRRSGKHTSEYVRCVDDVRVSLGVDGAISLHADDEPATAMTDGGW